MKPVNKNDRLTVHVEDLTHDGAGVAKVDGYPLFIPGALPGEDVSVHVLKTLKSYGFAKLIEIQQASPFRVTAPCPVFDTCGGCQIQHLSYEGQMTFKRKLVRDAITRIGKLPDVPVHPVKGMEDPWRYRNKSQIPFGTQDGKVVAGFYQPRSHDIADTDTCLIQTPEADAIMVALKNNLVEIGIEPYEEATHRGMLRHVVVRKARATGEIMVVLVTKKKKFAHSARAIELIQATVPEVTSIVQNINHEKTNVIFGDETVTLWGKDVIEDRIGNVRFEISARSFYQINPIQTEILYGQALEYAQLTGQETVIDAYCGIGTISLFLAKQAKFVMGVEIVPQAIEDAKRNAELNGLTNTLFEAGPAEQVIPRWYKEGKQADVLVVDPPRKGCDEQLLRTILKQRPSRVVYVSCNPATLARDLRILEDGGYRTKEVQPVDMFPQTTHCEAVAWLELEK
ncbi:MULTISPECIES: 23S rRNA (uracil(1939)-C(5))-methyltransferase RlmD [Planococcus]|uniref:23S rRNA (Uracil(1939)-C(5))-methyltransferase RlmD n=1 Tax=Planococcus faecalis TaxID=1598147 RepID=A0ABM6IQS0_9BACL|nr:MULTISPECIES: 23S rRNA (uracil(1939)-C(5))-methyltransferase RlmD [Planococcus]AQU78641.1 23S rRNA (uracil(1939)-C(5))-methyltransferase RlmD [Planococcus faecalis]MDJ0333190.1 23S rRNA (uracil(1939)-C(5))-methyltransferase RlmD [Planococcus sp. S3-L1]OHX54470.1 23S rRNA (uracil-5-)-methyltransferase RumA [Planococcus faecalis]